MYKNKYKKGSYGSGIRLTQNAKVASQQRARYAKTMATARGGSAPLATRGFGSMAYSSNREKKFFDIGVTAYQANTTGSFTLLHVPQVGADYNQRVGRKTIIKSIYIRGRAQLENAANVATTTTPAQQTRMIIFLDSQPNGAAPAVTDLLLSAEPAAQLNPNNRDRFKVIKDKMFIFDPLVISTTATQSFAIANRTMHDIKCYKKLNIETVFNATNAGTIGDINTGALYMFWIGSVAAGANVDANAVVSTRVRFDDS